MEAIVLAGLVGLGYVISKSTKHVQQTNKTEGFDVLPIPKRTTTLTNPELDIMYQYPNGQIYPSEFENSDPKGTSFDYATRKEKTVPENSQLPRQSPSKNNIPTVEFRTDGIEKIPTYVEDEYVISPLSGEKIHSSEFKHNNMQPFFGGRIRQNTDPNVNKPILDAYNGSDSLGLKKVEVETMFSSMKPFGNPHGNESNVSFIQSRMEMPATASRNGEKPFEPIRSAPAIGEKGGTLGKGGFHQFEVNEIMRPKTTNEIRVATDPQETYMKPVIPGAHFIGLPSEDTGDICKYRPERYYEDPTGSRYFTTTGDVIKESVRPVQILQHTTRPETTQEYGGPAKSQDFNPSYVSGSYRSPMTQQYADSGYRNVNLEGYMPSSNIDNENSDYGKHSYTPLPNERSLTEERNIGLNLKPSDTGNVSIHFQDNARPTRRSETIGNIRTAGSPVGFNGGEIPLFTVRDPKDIARTTVKEGTIYANKFGIAGPNSAPSRIKVYDPEDIARKTQKESLMKNSWYGPSSSFAKDLTDHTASENMRTDTSKEQIAKGRKPIAGAGENPLFTGDHGIQKTHKLNSDFINNRSLVVNRSIGVTPGAEDMGQFTFRTPLDNTLGIKRNTEDIIQAALSNPLLKNQSLHSVGKQ